MKKNLFFAAIAAAALLVGCTKELVEKMAPATGEQSFTAVREGFIDDLTKATFDGTTFGWEEGDSLIISDGTVSSKFIVTSVSGSTAAISIKAGETPLAASGVTYKAYYPCSIASGSMLQEQVNKANPMYAESTTDVLEFKNLCGLVKVVVTTPEESPELTKVIVKDAAKPLYGPYTVSNGKLVYSSPEDGSFGWAAVNKEAAGSVKTYYFAIPEGDYSAMEIIPMAENNQSQAVKMKSGSTLSVERNKVYTLNINADNLCYYLPSPDRKGTGETANCYNVKVNSGKCGFPAVKGNSNEALEGVDSVKVLWRAYYNSNANDYSGKMVTDAAYKDGIITFTSKPEEGNVVIAAYGNEGTILWSWHIWCTSSLVGDEQYPNGKYYMDRNLGAFESRYYKAGNTTSTPSVPYYTSVKTAGLLYQWGRKDPFTGRATVNAKGSTSSYGKEGVAKTINTGGGVSIETAIANPTVYYVQDVKYPIWCTSNISWDGAEKSLYDPCPAGYRVWANDAWGTPAAADYTVVSKIGSKDGTAQVVLGYSYGTYAFYTTTGTLDHKTGNFSSGMAHSRIWHRTVTSSRVGWYQIQHSGTAISSVSIGGGQMMRTSYGMAVRCERVTE